MVTIAHIQIALYCLKYCYDVYNLAHSLSIDIESDFIIFFVTENII